MTYQIAIDGPAGAGKSTIAKKLARTLGWIYVDTGAMYRAVALFCIRGGIDIRDEAAIVNALPGIDIDIIYNDEGQQVILNGENVNGFIRTEEVSAITSAVSAYGPVRAKVDEISRSIAARNSVVMDGRDIGTTVLPDATTKIFLTASVEERANRRYKEYIEKGIEADLEEIKADIEKRDENDRNREISPLRQADDAVLVDSSFMSIDEVVEEILEIHRGSFL